jgi:hypothetical protein
LKEDLSIIDPVPDTLFLLEVVPMEEEEEEEEEEEDFFLGACDC